MTFFQNRVSDSSKTEAPSLEAITFSQNGDSDSSSLQGAAGLGVGIVSAPGPRGGGRAARAGHGLAVPDHLAREPRLRPRLAAGATPKFFPQNGEQTHYR